MAWGKVVGFPEDGRQQNQREASVAINVVPGPTLQEAQGDPWSHKADYKSHIKGCRGSLSLQ